MEDSNEQRQRPPTSAYSNPHWKADESYIKEADSSKSIRIPAKALNITWGNDSRFWQWINLTEDHIQSTEFEEGALLHQVNWIEVTGRLAIMPCMGAASITEYEIVYSVKFRADAFGWHSAPIKFKVRFNDGEERVESVVLEPYRSSEKQGAWIEIPGGSFTVSSKDRVGGGGVVEFCMSEVETDWWKGGLILAGIHIRPKLA